MLFWEWYSRPRHGGEKLDGITGIWFLTILLRMLFPSQKATILPLPSSGDTAVPGTAADSYLVKGQESHEIHGEQE